MNDFEKGFLGPCKQVFCDHREKTCLHLAARDLGGDIEKVFGERPTLKRFLPREENGFILVGSISNAAFRARAEAYELDVSSLEGQWEAYRVQSFGAQHQNLLLCGSDERGAMWAVYEFAEKVLDVDPLGFLTDHEPLRQAAWKPETYFIEDAPRTFKYRGWFLNDEDLLSEWKNGGGKRYIEYRFYQQVVHQDVFARVLETALRLKQNLIIPASFLDIDNPAEENLVRMAVERGLFVTQHHIEALGVSHFALENYWKARGQEVPSFVLDRERMIETWTYYVRKWAQFGDQVLWQLGLRGRGDRPVWDIDPNVSVTSEGRGALISEAIACQHRIVREVTGLEDVVTSTTLWAEGTELHKAGHLQFPPGTIVVFADNLKATFAEHSMYAHQWRADFYDVQRRSDLRYGIYYHVAVWDTGPHLAQGVPPAKAETCIRQAVEHGDATYVITNVSNLREFVLGVREVAELSDNIKTFDRSQFMENWCRRQFGVVAGDVLNLYQDWHKAYIEVEAPGAPHPALLHDGVMVYFGGYWLRYRLLDLGCTVPERLTYWSVGLLPGSKVAPPPPKKRVETQIAEMLPALSASFERWRHIEAHIQNMSRHVPEDRRAFFDHHFRIQAFQMRALTEWAWALSLAFSKWQVNNRDSAIGPFLDQAASALGTLLEEREKSATGKWKHWYRGDRKMDVPILWENTVLLQECFKNKKNEE